MKRVALLGFPLSHSVSPLMHNAAFSALKLPWHYEALEVAPVTTPTPIMKSHLHRIVGLPII